MSKTIRTYTDDGVRVLYPIDFTLGYLRQEYVYVYTGDDFNTQLSYTWVNESEIQLDAPVAIGVDFNIRRIVPRDQLVNVFEDEAIRRALNINDSYRQPLMILEEYCDGFMVLEGDWSLMGDLDMNNFNIINLADGVNPGDGVNFAQLEEVRQLITGGAESFNFELFVDGVDYTAGVDDNITLAQDPGSKNNTWIWLNDTYISQTEYSITGTFVQFVNPIPGGTTSIDVKYGNAIPVAAQQSDSGRKVFNFTDEDVDLGDAANGFDANLGAYIRINGSTTSIVTVPLDATLNYPEGTEFTIKSNDTIEVTLFNTVGITFNLPTPVTAASMVIGEGGTVTIKKAGPDEWDVSGRLVGA